MPELTEIHSGLITAAVDLNRTSQGRVATELSYKKLGLKTDKRNQQALL
jgi:hypothetical protein